MKKNLTIREKAQYLDALADDGNEIYTAPGPDHWRYWRWVALQDVRKAAEELA